MKTIAAVLVLFLLLGKDDDAKAQIAEEKSFGKALLVGSPNGKTGARGATFGQSEEGNFLAPFERPALHPGNRHTDSKHYAVASTEPAVEMRVLPETDQSISRFLPYMWTALDEGGGSNVSRRTYIAKKITEIAEKEEINMDRMGRRTRPTRVELKQPDAQKPQSRIQERKRIQRTERGNHQGWEGQQGRRREEWIQGRTTMDSASYAEYASEAIAGDIGTKFRGSAIEAVDDSAEEIEDGVATGTPRFGPGSADGRCQEPDQSASLSSSSTRQLEKSPQGIQSSASPIASNVGGIFGNVSGKMARLYRRLSQTGSRATSQDQGSPRCSTTEHRTFPRMPVSNRCGIGNERQGTGRSQRRGHRDGHVDKSGRDYDQDVRTDARDEEANQCGPQRFEKAKDRPTRTRWASATILGWTAAVFSTGRCVSLSQIAYQSPQALAWLHPVAMQKDFVTTWEAQEQAADLAWECGYSLDLGVRRNGNGDVSKRDKRDKKQRISFHNDIEIYFYEEMISGHITVPEEILRQMDQKPWGMSATSEATFKPGDDDGEIGAVEWIPTVPTRGIGAIAARIVQDLDHQGDQQGESELDAEIETSRDANQLHRDSQGHGIVSYAFREGDQGARRLQMQRGRVQWQQRIKRQWQDVFGNEPITIKIIEPQPSSEFEEDLHVMVYAEDLNPACILVDIKDGSGLLHRGLQYHQSPVTGFEVLANKQVEPHRWDGALFRRNGRIWRGWDRVRHQHGWYWSILLEDEEPQEDEEESSLMQRVIRGEATSSSCEGQVTLHLFHRRADYRPAVLRSGGSIEEVVNEAWRLPGHGPQAIRQLHDVLYPPNFVNERDSVIIVELNADEESKFQPDEVLCLLQIVFASGSADTSGDIDVFRTLWTPTTASRQDILYHFRVAEQCQRRYGVRCEIKVNQVMWREQDSIIKHFENGDFVKIVIYPAPGDDAAVTRQVFCRQEMHQRNRRVLQSSSSDSEEGHEESQEEAESERTERSRSRGRNQSEEEDDDAPTLIQLNQREHTRRESWKILKSHVFDRWCTSDWTVSTDLDVPQSRKTISLEELIETDWTPSGSIKRSLVLDVDGEALQDFQKECEQTKIIKLLPEVAFDELTPVAKAWHKTCETGQNEPSTIYIYVDGSAMGGPSLDEQYKAAAFAVVMYGEDESLQKAEALKVGQEDKYKPILTSAENTMVRRKLMQSMLREVLSSLHCKIVNGRKPTL